MEIWGVFIPTLNLSPSVPNRYINKLCLILTSPCMKLIMTNIEVKVGIYLKEKD